MKILVATTNTGKIKELKKLFEDLPVDLIGLNKFPDLPDVEETGQTFAENAAIKAQYYARATNLNSIADDSGLEVEALGNAPGVFSARYAGENASDRDRIEKLLRELKQTESENRRARFVCSMVVTDEAGKIIYAAEGICEGTIAEKPLGDSGFGYDPIFIPEGFDETFGMLSDETKQKISHRARAAEKIIRFFRDFIGI